MNDTGDPIGAQIDGLGVVASLNEGDLIEAAVVLLKVIDPEGAVRVKVAWSDGMDWTTRRGLIEVARDTERVE